MKYINFLTASIVPFMIMIVVIFGIREKKNVFDLFIDGANEGLKLMLTLFPTLLGLFVAINLLRTSGIIDLVSNFFQPILACISMPKELVPLAILRPVSGSSTIAIATEIMKNYGPDSPIGLMTSTIMGSTETTLYTIAIYSSQVRAKNTKKVMLVALLGDFLGIMVSIQLWNLILK